MLQRSRRPLRQLPTSRLVKSTAMCGILARWRIVKVEPAEGRGPRIRTKRPLLRAMDSAHLSPRPAAIGAQSGAHRPALRRTTAATPAALPQTALHLPRRSTGDVVARGSAAHAKDWDCLPAGHPRWTIIGDARPVVYPCVEPPNSDSACGRAGYTASRAQQAIVKTGR
jgi:hypothetical protein